MLPFPYGSTGRGSKAWQLPSPTLSPSRSQEQLPVPGGCRSASGWKELKEDDRKETRLHCSALPCLHFRQVPHVRARRDFSTLRCDDVMFAESWKWVWRSFYSPLFYCSHERPPPPPQWHFLVNQRTDSPNLPLAKSQTEIRGTQVNSIELLQENPCIKIASGNRAG